MTEYKEILNSVKDVDEATRRVKVVMSEVDSKDLDEDVIDNKAYQKTVKERGPAGTKLIWHLTDHIALLKNAVGKPDEIGMDGKQLYFLTTIPATNWGNDVLKFYQNGDINQHSVGFSTVDSEVVNKGQDNEYRLIKEIKLYEGSAVLWGANPNTPTVSVGKSLTREEAVSEYAKTLVEMRRLNKMFKSAYLTDETFGLIELKISQLADRLEALFEQATKAADEARSPVNDESDAFKNACKTFTNRQN